MNAARKNFIGKAFVKANPVIAEPQRATRDVYGGGTPCEDTVLQAQMLKLLGPQKKKIEEVDMLDALTQAGLENHFEVNQWPSSGAVRELALHMKNKSFVAVDLRK